MKNDSFVEVEILDWTQEGQGVGRVDGQTIFVESAELGAFCKVHITEQKKRFLKGVCVEILKRADYAVASPCPKQGICDGCSLIGIEYDKQLAWKEKSIRDSLTRIGGFSVGDVEMIPAAQWAYRNKVEMRIADDGKLSYYNRGTHQTVAVDECPVAVERIDVAIGVWAKRIAPILAASISLAASAKNVRSPKEVIQSVQLRANRTEELMITIDVQDKDAEILPHLTELIQTNLKPEVLAIHENEQKKPWIDRKNLEFITPRRILEEELMGMQFQISPESFFQVNRDTAEILYEQAIALFDDLEKTTVLDLYCGTGTTSLLLAKRARRVIGVEFVRQAVKDAKENAKRNGVENVKFFADRAEDVIDKLVKAYEIKAAIVDPPRQGMDKKVTEAIANSNIETLVYISCNPATQARDMKILAEHGFALQKIVGLDQFPNTGHVEALVLMTREGE